MARQGSGRGLNSTDTLVILANAAEVPVPDYVLLKSTAAQFWPIFTTSRTPNQWREVDLILVGKLCNLEADIRQYGDALAQSTAIVMSKSGPKENPLFGILARLQNEQLSILRSLAMNMPANMAAPHAGQAAKRRALRNTLDEACELLAKG